MSSPESLVKALAEGLVSALLAAGDAAPVSVPAVKPPAKKRRRSGGPLSPSRASSSPEYRVREELPTPGFDPSLDSQPLPGFEDVPPATLRDMQAAMDRIMRGNSVPPGFYEKDDPERRVPGTPLS